MKRQPLIYLLECYFPSDAEEIKAKAKMLAFIHTHEDCFERSLAVGHITASSWLLSSDGSKALLMHHAKLGRWVQLGGHSDGNPNTLEVAIQEAREESGLASISAVTPLIFDIDIHQIPDNPKEKAHLHYDVRFLLRAEGEQEVKKNHESKQLLWVTKEWSCLPTDERSVVRMFEKWLRFTP